MRCVDMARKSRQGGAGQEVRRRAKEDGSEDNPSQSSPTSRTAPERGAREDSETHLALLGKSGHAFFLIFGCEEALE